MTDRTGKDGSIGSAAVGESYDPSSSPNKGEINKSRLIISLSRLQISMSKFVGQILSSMST